ncbi:MAG: M20 metallopeptidase family protein [Clostridium sp.]
MNKFLNEVNLIKDELIAIRRDFHENPEIGFEEFRTSQKIKDFLEYEGISYVSVANTGVCALIKGEKDGGGRTIAIRGDIDGLPIQDKKTCTYSSKVSGKMHACGHDAHTTIALGAAKILNNNKKLFSGNVKIFFEPAEETVGGARYMIDEGVLESPVVDAVIGLHVTEDLECGKIRIKKGVVNAASNPFKVIVKGKGGHGAHPETTVDPVVIASHIVIALQTIVSREIAPVNPAVITVGSIHGGTAQNIIPEEVTISGIIRTMTKEDREYAIKRLREIVEGICLSSRGEGIIEIEESYPCLYNDDNIVDIVYRSAGSVIGEENVLEQLHPSMGVESFAYFAMEKPSAFYFLGTGNKNKDTMRPAHSSLFNIDEDALSLGVAIQCQAAIDYLTRE